MRAKTVTTLTAVALAVAFDSSVARADGPLVVKPVLSTAPLYSYEDAPATPDLDDPAIWINRHNSQTVSGHRYRQRRRPCGLRAGRQTHPGHSAAECTAGPAQRPGHTGRSESIAGRSVRGEPKR